jgi:hypothetical protein
MPSRVVKETNTGVGQQDKRREEQKAREDLMGGAFTSYTDPGRNIAVGDDADELSKQRKTGPLVGQKCDADSAVYHKQVIRIRPLLPAPAGHVLHTERRL